VQLLDFIACIEASLGKKAQKRLLPMQDGDVPATYADMNALSEWVGFRPVTLVEKGIEKFAGWYASYYSV
jgi:UDP-glucuronate 4-epimerase